MLIHHAEVNCVILESEPVGVMLVAAVALAAMSVRTTVRRMASAPWCHCTPNCAGHDDADRADEGDADP